MVVPALMAIHGSIDEVDETLVGVATRSFCAGYRLHTKAFISVTCALFHSAVCAVNPLFFPDIGPLLPLIAHSISAMMPPFTAAGDLTTYKTSRQHTTGLNRTADYSTMRYEQR
jgi:hypothetical protein